MVPYRALPTPSQTFLGSRYPYCCQSCVSDISRWTREDGWHSEAAATAVHGCLALSGCPATTADLGDGYQGSLDGSRVRIKRLRFFTKGLVRWDRNVITNPVTFPCPRHRRHQQIFYRKVEVAGVPCRNLEEYISTITCSRIESPSPVSSSSCTRLRSPPCQLSDIQLEEELSGTGPPDPMSSPVPTYMRLLRKSTSE